MGPLSADQLHLMQTMDRNASQLAALIEDVLDLSLLKAGRRPLRPKPSDLGALLRQAQSTWQAAAQSRTVRVACGELPPVYMDAEAVRDVVDHLLRNALRHAPERSEITLSASCANGMAQVAVRDHGPGIPPEQLARLFQPFVHVQTPDAPGSQGSGLGLAYCRQVIERHRGAIRAESAEGEGTTVTFTLPVASTHFLFQEACRSARDEAEYDKGQYGLVLVAPPASGQAGSMPKAGELLRQNTHRGDQFIWLDSQSLAIVAVTDQPGLETMVARLRRLLERARLDIRLGWALFPRDGGDADRLLEAARAALVDLRGTASHGTMREVMG
jgi:anti-sigma regulatory factor (Ser/Thr protein kinase)